MYKTWIEVISKTELFSNINDDELLAMLYCLQPEVKEYKKDEIIALEGHEIKGIGVVLAGNLIVSKDYFDGTRIIMNKMNIGDMFGEIAAFSEKKVWPATVIALQDCAIMFVPPEKIIGTCHNACLSHRSLILNMLKIVSNKAIILNKKIEYLSIKSIREKICKFLLEQYKKQKSLTMYLNMNRNEMSDFLNISRPSLSREMSLMKTEGIIDYYRSSFKILDLKKMVEYIS